jgi:predicted alpha/beta hydrolase family esterase
LVLTVPKEKNRPLIFIGHSLGGIVILQVRSRYTVLVEAC